MSERSPIVEFHQKPVDLLPWADPYIARLFAEARLLDEDTDCSSSAARSLSNVAAGGKATSEAIMGSGTWRISPLRRQEDSRRRRTESEHLMAHC